MKYFRIPAIIVGIVIGLAVNAVLFVSKYNRTVRELRREVSLAEAKGRREILDYFAEDRAFMGPLVITNDGVTVSNILVYYVPPTVEIEAAIHFSGGTSNVVTHAIVDMGNSASGAAFKFSATPGSSLIGNTLSHNSVTMRGHWDNQNLK